MPRPILLDTDPGVDDALALLLAFASPELQVVAVTCVAGNTDVERATRNALRLVEWTGAGVPVSRGAADPLEYPLFRAEDVHGDDGLGGVLDAVDMEGMSLFPPLESAPIPEPAPEVIVRNCRERPGITIVAVGPLTNLALAFMQAPEVRDNVAEVIVMGGALRVPGNTTPTAEFNFYVDPHAARFVLESGVPVTLIPLDVTEQCVLWSRDLTGGERQARWISRVTRFTRERHRVDRGLDGMYLHDPLAVGVAIRPSLVSFESLGLEVVTAGELRGTTREVEPAAGRKTTRVATRVDASRLRDLVCQRLRCGI